MVLYTAVLSLLILTAFAIVVIDLLFLFEHFVVFRLIHLLRHVEVSFPIAEVRAE